jgi:hypothetical protein
MSAGRLFKKKIFVPDGEASRPKSIPAGGPLDKIQRRIIYFSKPPERSGAQLETAFGWDDFQLSIVTCS